MNVWFWPNEIRWCMLSVGCCCVWKPLMGCPVTSAGRFQEMNCPLGMRGLTKWKERMEEEERKEKQFLTRFVLRSPTQKLSRFSLKLFLMGTEIRRPSTTQYTTGVLFYGQNCFFILTIPGRSSLSNNFCHKVRLWWCTLLNKVRR